jgi:hypothetical protein
MRKQDAGDTAMGALAAAAVGLPTTAAGIAALLSPRQGEMHERVLGRQVGFGV